MKLALFRRIITNYHIIALFVYQSEHEVRHEQFLTITLAKGFVGRSLPCRALAIITILIITMIIFRPQNKR
jgi:hypothetical protein